MRSSNKHTTIRFSLCFVRGKKRPEPYAIDGNSHLRSNSTVDPKNFLVYNFFLPSQISEPYLILSIFVLMGVTVNAFFKAIIIVIAANKTVDSQRTLLPLSQTSLKLVSSEYSCQRQAKNRRLNSFFSLRFACQLHVSLFYKVHLQMKTLTILFFKRDQKTEKNFLDRCPLNCTLLYYYRSKPLVRGRQSLKLIGRTKVKARRAPINSLSFATRFYF